jgi:transposase InsO family protein
MNPNFYQRFRKHQNQIIRLDNNRPEQVWVSDIIYIGKEKACYLGIVTDTYSKKLMGYNMIVQSSIVALKWH